MAQSQLVSQSWATLFEKSNIVLAFQLWNHKLSSQKHVVSNKHAYPIQEPHNLHPLVCEVGSGTSAATGGTNPALRALSSGASKSGIRKLTPRLHPSDHPPVNIHSLSS